MLQEISHTRQMPGEPRRRWFCEEIFDLIAWYSDADTITGFQLCYRNGPDEKALTWHRDRGFSHHQVDDGENRPAHYKMTPIILPDGKFDSRQVLSLFEAASREIDPQVVKAVADKIRKHPSV